VSDYPDYRYPAPVGATTTTEKELTTVPAGQTVEMIKVTGKGRNLMLRVRVEHDELKVYVKVDDSTIYSFKPKLLNTFNYTNTTPGVQLLLYTTAGDCYIQILIPYEFTSSFAVEVENPLTTDYRAMVIFTYLALP